MPAVPSCLGEKQTLNKGLAKRIKLTVQLLTSKMICIHFIFNNVGKNSV
ncbi:rCG40581 [Rattus norvegicus]|uniref:RCG40581 n=1 Tax=Rattus norvegicus TaxID=10116 RepID=A6I8Q2_RAT|nr:rCG40581 [Rattus norvegicus]